MNTERNSAKKPAPDKKQMDKLFADYLKSQNIVIVDASGSSRKRLMKMMIDLGATTSKVQTYGKYDEALAILEQIKPEVVITDYLLSPHSGFDLLQKYRSILKGVDTQKFLTIMVTSSTSQSTVAQAAEEDIDGFILKPYTIETFKNTLISNVTPKLFPNDYQKKIQEGKELYFQMKADESIKVLEEAKKLHSTPTLALFYIAQCETLKKALEEARANYQSGLNLNKIHYKCLIGLFELLMNQKEFEAAYEVVKKISKYFPANPDRMGTVLRLAIQNKKYDDIEGYYQVFTQLDSRNDSLLRSICAGLIVTAKFYFSTQSNTRAVELIQKAAITCAGHPGFLLECIEVLCINHKVEEALEALKRFHISEQKSKHYRTAELWTKYANGLHAKEILRPAKDLIKENEVLPSLFSLTIRAAAEAKLQDEISFFMSKAEQHFPDSVEKLNEVIRKCRKK